MSTPRSIGCARPLLESQGFDVRTYDQTPRCRDRLTNAHRAVIAAQEKLQEEMGPLATAALLSEMTLTSSVTCIEEESS